LRRNRLIQTPNLDRLAAQGVRFRNHFVTTPICCVSRASIFTGQPERRHGISDFKTPLTAAQWAQSYPALLRAAGYHTGFIGKFGVGDAKYVASKERDFDYWRGLPGQAGECLSIPRTHRERTRRRDWKCSLGISRRLFECPAVLSFRQLQRASRARRQAAGIPTGPPR